MDILALTTLTLLLTFTQICCGQPGPTPDPCLPTRQTVCGNRGYNQPTANAPWEEKANYYGCLLFQYFDQDQNGVIYYTEFDHGLAKLKKERTAPGIERQDFFPEVQRITDMCPLRIFSLHGILAQVGDKSDTQSIVLYNRVSIWALISQTGENSANLISSVDLNKFLYTWRVVFGQMEGLGGCSATPPIAPTPAP